MEISQKFKSMIQELVRRGLDNFNFQSEVEVVKTSKDRVIIRAGNVLIEFKNKNGKIVPSSREHIYLSRRNIPKEYYQDALFIPQGLFKEALELAKRSMKLGDQPLLPFTDILQISKIFE